MLLLSSFLVHQFALKVLVFYRGKIKMIRSEIFFIYFLLSLSLYLCNILIYKNLINFSLSPYSFDVSPSSMDAPQVTHDTIPIGAIPLLASSTSEYQDAVSRVIAGANQVYHDFIKSEEGRGFTGQICFIGDSVGAILTYDALCRSVHSRHNSENNILDNQGIENSMNTEDGKHLTAPSPRRKSSSTW